MKHLKHAAIICTAILIGLCANAVTYGADKESSPAKVAILPFSMHAPSELSYLREGIRDMLASRLAWQGKVQVVDKAATEQAMKGQKADLALQDALRVGSSLKADYVLFGSLTALGNSISIDGKMAPVDGKSEPVNIFAQTNSLDEVIPKINQFAGQINAKIFGRAADATQTAAGGAENESASLRNPELLIPSTMQGSDRISYLNPNFIEVTPEGALRQAGIWRSQTFNEGILGMDVGDLDGDGKVELVTVGTQRLTVFRKENLGLKVIATYDSGKMDRFQWVTLVDTNRDGKAEIYVTAMHRYNDPRGNTSNRVGYGQDVVWNTSSFSLVLVNNKLQVQTEGSPYLLNGVELPGRGKILIGQQKGTDTTLKPDIYEMVVRGKSLTTGSMVPLPRQCNVFNFAMADLKGDHSQETVVVDDENRLLVLDNSGNQIWKSRHRFAATSNSFTGKVEDLRFNRVDYFYIPSPILVTDLNKDGISEVVINRSPDYSKFLPEGYKYYEAGEVVSLSNDQMGMIENWKTREISGMVTAIRIADLNGDGVPELIVSLVLAKDFLKLWEASKSTIFTYDLNVTPAKTAKAQ